MNRHKSLIISLLVLLLIGASPGLAEAGCEVWGGGLMLPQTNVIDTNNSNHANAFEINVTPDPLNAGSCDAGYAGTSWQFTLELKNKSNNLNQDFTVRFDNLQFVFKDGQSNQLGTFDVAGTDFPNWFNDGGSFNQPTGGQFSSQQYLDPGETCQACICAHLGGRTSGSIELVITYTVSDATYAFSNTEIIEIDSSELAPQIGQKVIGPASRRSLEPQAGGETVLVNGTEDTVTGINSVGDWAYFTANVGTADWFKVTLYNMDQNSDLYTKLNGTNPDTYTYDGRSIEAGTQSEVVQHYDLSNVTDLRVGVQHGGAGSSQTKIKAEWGSWPTTTDGQTSNLTLIKNESYWAPITVGTGSEGLEANLTNITGNPHLYIFPSTGNDPSADRPGSIPADQKSENAGTTAEQVIKPGADDTWWVEVQAQADTTTDLQVHYNAMTAIKPTESYPVNLEAGIWDYHKITIGSGVDELQVELTGMSAGENLDLYLRKDDLPDTTNYDDRSQNASGVAEEVTASTPAAGDYYVGVLAITDGSGNLSYMDYGVSGTIKGNVTLQP